MFFQNNGMFFKPSLMGLKNINNEMVMNWQV